MNRDLSYYLHRALVILTPVLCFLVAVGFYLKTYDSATIKITFTQIGGTLLIGLFLLRRLESGLRFSREEALFVLPVLAYFLWGCFSYIKSPFKMWASFDEFWRRGIYTGLFLIAFFEFRKLGDVKYFTTVLLITCFTVCFYGIIQKLRLDPYAWKDAFGHRRFSTFGNPNFFGAWLVGLTAFPLCYFFKARHMIVKVLYAGFFFLIVYNIHLTVAKGSFLGAAGTTICAVILMAIFAGFMNRKKVMKFLKIGIPFFIAGVIGLVYLAGNPTSYRFRIFTWMSGMEMTKKHPVVGTGIGSFKEVYPMFRHPEIFHIEGKHNTETDHFHCEFLEVFFDEGFIGFGIYLLILFITFYSAVGKLGKIERVTGSSARPELVDRTFLIIAWLSGAVGMLTQAAMSVHMRFVSSGHIFWLILGIVGALTFPEKEKKQFRIKMNDLVKILLEFAVVLITVYFIVFFRRFFIADVNHNIAIAYSKQGNWERALYHYDRVLRNWPRFIMAHYFTGNVYNDRWNLTPGYNPLWDKGLPKGTKRIDPQRTIAKYDDVLSLAPNYVQVHYQEGNIYLKMGKFEKAIEKFNKAMDIDPVFPLSPFRKGYCLVRLNRLTEAEAAFKQAIERKKDFTEAYTNLANVLYLQKKNDEAEFYYKKAADVSRSINSYFALLSFYQNTGKSANAREVCLEILKINPQNQKARDILKTL